MKPISGKHARFVSEYLIDGNATRAAKACGYSRKTAKQQGSRLLTNVDVRAVLGGEAVVEES
jgi:phage terminase small subunit